MRGGRPPVAADVKRGFSVCIVAPGHSLLPSAGPTRNMLSLAGALAERADVAVAFRRTLEVSAEDRFRVLEIQPWTGRQADPVDDAAVRGVGYIEFLSYLRDLRRFARQRVGEFDVVLEKSWLLSGYVSAQCRRIGVAAVPVENLVPVIGQSVRRDPLANVRHWTGRRLAGRYLRKAPTIVAETHHLKRAISVRWKIPAERIEVIPLGVDRGLFRPGDRSDARALLGLADDRTILLYVGVLDRAHNLEPAVRALARAGPSGVELHVVGDGALRPELERLVAESGVAAFFHGRVPHGRVPTYIAASDLCLAPYDVAAFPDGEVGYATLKVREYLAAGRPVATVKSGSLPELVESDVSGFLFDNDLAGWSSFLRDPPSREILRKMGERAAQTALPSWEDTARAYASVCEREIIRSRTGHS